jgi:hypothetical protein
MIRQRPHRPSLKITRHADRGRASSFTFEVWSPFTGTYQVVDSIEDGLQRVDQLAGLICQMWIQRHPKQDALTDAPDTDGTDTTEWAEFRINAATYRSYDTRRHDRPRWARAGGLVQATETTCARVRCVLPQLSTAR